MMMFSGKYLFSACVLAMTGLATSQSFAAVIVDDVVSGNGDASTDGAGAITSAWIGFEGGGAFAGLLAGAGDDDGFPADPIGRRRAAHRSGLHCGSSLRRKPIL